MFPYYMTMDAPPLERDDASLARRACEVTYAEFAAAAHRERLRLFTDGNLEGELSWRERSMALLRFGRPRTAVVGVVALALGASYGGEAPAWRVAVLAVAMFVCTLLANMLNTCTDVSEDIRNLPGRVFLLGRYGRRALERTCQGLAAALMLMAAALGIEALVTMVFCLLVIHQYSLPPLAAKRHPLIGLIVFAQAVTLPFLMGAVAQSDGAQVRRILQGALYREGKPWHDAQCFLAMAGFLFVWFMAKGMFKNVPDYDGDRQAGIRTSATVFRSRRGAAVTTAFATVAAYCSLGILVLCELASRHVLFALVWLAPAGYNLWRLVRASSAEEANRCLKVDMVVSTGFISTLLAVVAPSAQSFAIVSLGILTIALCDWLQVDTRRNADVCGGA